MDQNHDKIEAYLLGELDGTERMRFEAALDKDGALAQAVDGHRKAMAGLEQLRLRQKVKSAIAEQQPVNTKSTISRFFWMVATLLFLAVAAFLFFKKETAQPAPTKPQKEEIIAMPQGPASQSTDSDTLKPNTPVQQKKDNGSYLASLSRSHLVLPNTGAMRGDNATSATTSQQITKAFDEKKYTQALKLLPEEKDIAAWDDNLRYMRAQLHFQLGDYKSAQADFDALKNSFQYKHEARWNAALCLLASGQVKTARNALLRMSSEPYFPYQPKAAALLRLF
jgi:tetratricopeptide (TPR) repeat protein